MEQQLSLRTSVGQSEVRPVQNGWSLEIVIGHVRRVLGLYETDEAAVHALKDGRTGFPTWDDLERKASTAQLAALKRRESHGKAR